MNFNATTLTMVLQKTIGGAKHLGKIIIPFIAASILEDGGKRIMDKITADSVNTYDDAIKTILESGMYSSAKEDAIKLLKPGKNKTYYKTIANVVQSSTYASMKVDMIRDINASLDTSEES